MDLPAKRGAKKTYMTFCLTPPWSSATLSKALRKVMEKQWALQWVSRQIVHYVGDIAVTQQIAVIFQ